MGKSPAFGIYGLRDGTEENRRDPSHRHEFPQPESSEKSSGIRICGNDPFQYQSGF